MFNFEKPLTLPPQLKWKLAHEPEILGWTIRARNYDIFWANSFLLIVASILIAVEYLIYWQEDSQSIFWSLTKSMLPITIALAFAMTNSHRRVNLAYRFTNSGLEYCQWKDAPKWALALLKWLTVVTFLILLALATYDISFLLGALVGPGGMLLTYLSLAHNKNLQEIDTEYNHLTYEWHDFKTLTIATNREVVDLKYSKLVEEGKYLNTWSVNIYCQRKQKERVAQFLEPYLPPGTPILRAKADIW